jgi:solute carrier family 45 protein 1/2/4
MWFFGNSQFKVLCAIASLALAITVGISCAFIQERDPRKEGPPPTDKGGLISFFKQVFGSIKRLPPQTRRVCEVQFFAWIGWFPFLFYITTWVGELYVDPFFKANPDLTPEEIDHLYEKATRVGTFALLVWAITSFLSNLLLPLIVAPTYEAPIGSGMSIRSQKSYTTRTTRLLEKLIIPWLTLRRAWLLSHILFAVCMGMTFFVTTPAGATALVSFIGLSWALTLWAPFALISQEISKRDALRRSRQSTNEVMGGEEDNLDDQAGVILGIHNVAIASPQIIATVGSSIIFKLLQKPR